MRLLLLDDMDCVSLWQLQESLQPQSRDNNSSTSSMSHASHTPARHGWQRVEHWAGIAAAFNSQSDDVVAVVDPNDNLLMVVCGKKYETGIAAKVRICTRSTVVIVHGHSAPCTCHLCKYTRVCVLWICQSAPQGKLLGLQGGNVLWLSNQSQLCTDSVVYSSAIHALVASKRLAEACAIACLGATRCNWRDLCTAALDAMQLDVACTACVWGQEAPTLTLVRRLQQAVRAGASHQELQAMRLAFEVCTRAQTHTHTHTHTRIKEIHWVCEREWLCGQSSIQKQHSTFNMRVLPVQPHMTSNLVTPAR